MSDILDIVITYLESILPFDPIVIFIVLFYMVLVIKHKTIFFWKHIENLHRLDRISLACILFLLSLYIINILRTGSFK